MPRDRRITQPLNRTIYRGHSRGLSQLLQRGLLHRGLSRFLQSISGTVHLCFFQIFFIAAAILLSIHTIVSAATNTYFWKVSSGDWSTASNWGGTEPTSSDEAQINNGGTVTITQTNEKCYNLYVGYSSTNTGTVQITNGNLNTSYNEYLGYSGNGTFTETGGSNTINGSLYIGYNSGSSGIYNLSGGTDSIYGSLYLGYNSNSTGKYNLLSDTSSLFAGYTYIGYSGSGTFTQTGGTYSGTLYLGFNADSSGTYNLSNTGKLTLFKEYIGYSGNGIFTQTGGIHTGAYIKIGTGGNYTLSGGTLNVNDGFVNQGIWNLSNSSPTINISASIVDLSAGFVTNSSKATLSLDSKSLLIVAPGFNPANHFHYYTNAGILHEAGSTLDISSSYHIGGAGSINDYVNCQGSLTGDPDLYIDLKGGLNVSGNGIVILTLGSLYVNDAISGMSGGTLNASCQYIGHTGTGTFTQTGGSNACTNSSCLYLGYNSGSSGIYNLSGTGKLSANYEYVGNTGTGALTQIGGKNIVYDIYLGYNSGSSGTYNLNGGTLTLNSLSKGSGTAAFNFGGGTLTASGSFTCLLPMTITGEGGNANIDTKNYTVTLSGVLSGNGGLNKLGSGTLILSATNTYKGGTFFSSGYISAAALTRFGSGKLTFNGGGLLFTGTYDPSSLGISINSSGAFFNTNNYSVTFANALSGNGGLNKLGSGTLMLSATETYSGNTTVNGGTLVFSGGIGAGGTSLIDVESGTAVLKTTGVSKLDLNVYTAASGVFEAADHAHMVGNISGGGTTKVDAGASLIVKSISQGALTIGAGGMLTIRPTVYTWNGGGADNLWTNNDNWDVDMAPTISDNIILSAGAAKLLNFNDFAPDIEFDSLTVCASGYNIQGNALHSAKVTVLPGVSFQCKGIYANTLTIGSGATVTIEAISGGPQGGAITPVPEPGAWILLATACLAMLAYRRAIGCRL